jgi:hypothetical protein
MSSILLEPEFACNKLCYKLLVVVLVFVVVVVVVAVAVAAAAAEECSF